MHQQGAVRIRPPEPVTQAASERPVNPKRGQEAGLNHPFAGGC